eukprot:scaffold21579_cov73-Phaeocystis_antarctica.AAC.1
MISGARYSGVPHSVQVRYSTFLANPKSVTLQLPSLSRSRFSGLRSRYRMPRPWSVIARRVVGKAPRLSQVREELTADDIIEEEVESLVVLESAQHIDDEGVLDLLQDLLLGLHMVNLLERIVPVVCLVLDQSHSAEAAGAERSPEFTILQRQLRKFHWHRARPPAAPTGAARTTTSRSVSGVPNKQWSVSRRVIARCLPPLSHSGLGSDYWS